MMELGCTSNTQTSLRKGAALLSSSFKMRIEKGDNFFQNKSSTQTREPEFRCPLCQYRSQRKPNVLRHIRLIHANVQDRPFICPICPMRFRLKQALMNHIRTHTGEKPYKCKRCSTRFTNHGSLNYHLRKSTDCNV